jgi:hypothetical protein
VKDVPKKCRAGEMLVDGQCVKACIGDNGIAPCPTSHRKPMDRWYKAGFYNVHCTWQPENKQWGCTFYVDGDVSHSREIYVGSVDTPEKELMDRLNGIMDYKYKIKKLTAKSAMADNAQIKALKDEDEEIRRSRKNAGPSHGSTMHDDNPDKIEATTMRMRAMGGWPVIIRKPLSNPGGVIIENFSGVDGAPPPVIQTANVTPVFDVSVEEAKRRFELAMERMHVSYSPDWDPVTDYGRKMQADYDSWLATQKRTSPPFIT